MRALSQALQAPTCRRTGGQLGMVQAAHASAARSVARLTSTSTSRCRQVARVKASASSANGSPAAAARPMAGSAVCARLGHLMPDGEKATVTPSRGTCTCSHLNPGRRLIVAPSKCDVDCRAHNRCADEWQMGPEIDKSADAREAGIGAANLIINAASHMCPSRGKIQCVMAVLACGRPSGSQSVSILHKFCLEFDQSASKLSYIVLVAFMDRTCMVHALTFCGFLGSWYQTPVQHKSCVHYRKSSKSCQWKMKSIVPNAHIN